MYYTTDNSVSQEGNTKTLERKFNINPIRDRKWITYLSKHVSQSTLQRCRCCGRYVVTKEDETRMNYTIEQANFCGNRMCPNCSSRKSFKDAQCIISIAKEMVASKKVMIHITLTVPNVEGKDLRNAIDHLNKSWQKLLRKKRYGIFKDHIRRVEVSYNKDMDTYHPHLHILAFTKSTCFNQEYYVNTNTLLADWKAATGMPDITQVKIKYIHKGTIDSIIKSVYNISRYIAKPADMYFNEKVFDTFYTALYRLKIITYNGLCKEMRRKYLQNKPKPTDDETYMYRVFYHLASLENSDTYVEEEKALLEAKKLASHDMAPDDSLAFKDLVESDDFNDLD